MEDKDPTVESVFFGKLMAMVAMNERWIYKGSMTYPPCNQFVYWNIINRVFPVSQEIVDLVGAKLAKTGINTEGTGGNYRVTSHGFNNEVYYVYSGAMKLTSFVAASLLMLMHAF